MARNIFFLRAKVLQSDKYCNWWHAFNRRPVGVELRVNCASSHVTPRFWSNREIKAFTQVVKDAASSLEVLEVTGPAGFFPSASHAGGRRREPISESRELDPALEALFEAACESEDRASPTHLCPPLHHYVHHRSAPRRPRSQLQASVETRLPYGEVSRNVEVLLRALIGVAVWRTLPPPARRAAFTWASTGRTRRGSCRSGPTPLSHPHATSHHQPAREQVPLHAGRLRARGARHDSHQDEAALLAQRRALRAVGLGGVQLAWDS